MNESVRANFNPTRLALLLPINSYAATAYVQEYTLPVTYDNHTQPLTTDSFLFEDVDLEWNDPRRLLITAVACTQSQPVTDRRVWLKFNILDPGIAVTLFPLAFHFIVMRDALNHTHLCDFST